MMRIGSAGIAVVAAAFLFFPPADAAEQKGPAEAEFCRLDKNSNREITSEEFSACEFHKLEHVRSLPYADPELSEKSERRRLSDEELKAYLFNRADKNKNRKIDRQEWEEFYRSLTDLQ
jgi:hypothetical protein